MLVVAVAQALPATQEQLMAAVLEAVELVTTITAQQMAGMALQTQEEAVAEDIRVPVQLEVVALELLF